LYSDPGTYTLVFSSSKDKPIVIGKLGILLLKPGFYVYVGSAFGPGGLQSRIKHHINHSSRPHWHLDYLSPAIKLCEIWYTYDQIRREHQWATIHSQTKGAILPLPGFGSSDCRCLSHLFFYKSKPSGNNFHRRIRAKFNDHAKIMIKKSEKLLDNKLISDIH
jgi:Uri superfamily endonuclease